MCLCHAFHLNTISFYSTDVSDKYTIIQFQFVYMSFSFNACLHLSSRLVKPHRLKLHDLSSKSIYIRYKCFIWFSQHFIPINSSLFWFVLLLRELKQLSSYWRKAFLLKNKSLSQVSIINVFSLSNWSTLHGKDIFA